MSDKKYIIEYMNYKDKGWIQYACCDTPEEARELIGDLDLSTFKEVRIVTISDDNTAIFKKGINVKELINWLQKIDPDKEIQARDNTGDWCTAIQLSDMMEFVYIQSLPKG